MKCFNGACIAIFIAWSVLFATEFSSNTKIAAIPSEDRAFFLSQLRNTLRAEFGFTLIGIKPLSLDEFIDYELNNAEKRQKFIQYLKLLFKDSPRFTLRVLDEGDTCSAFLIDRRAFQQLGEDPDAVLQFETIKIGQLFGYGKENAHFYLRRLTLGTYLNKIPIVWLVPMAMDDLLAPLHEKMFRSFEMVQVPFKLPQPAIDSQFHSLEEEWEWIVQHNCPNEAWDIAPFWIRKPQFIKKKGAATQKIIKNLNDGADMLGTLLHDDHWFDLVLSIINQGT